MANPKRKHSKARSRSRRANYYNRLEEPQLTECSNCSETRVRHHACPKCGFYRGRQVMKAAQSE